MALTYKQLQKQIEQLQRQAESLRSKEVTGVVERIKVAIAHYGLTAAHLGLETRASAGGTKRTVKAGIAKSRAAFADGLGNAWSTDRRFNRMRPSIAPRKRHQAG